MSLKLVVALDAQIQWRDLGFEAQEAILDELDKLAAEGAILPGVVEIVHDWEIREGRVEHTYFLHVLLEPPTITVLGVGHVVK